MKTEVLLTSEIFIKNISNISDNLDSKFLRPAIQEAQDMHLQPILGAALYARLKELVRTREIDEPVNAKYRDLLEFSQYFIAYQSISGLPYRVGYKIANAGVVTTPDEKVQPVSGGAMSQTSAYYQNKADFYARRIQEYLLERYREFPELSENDCYHMRRNLRSAATCSIWLGGARGRKIRR